MSAPDASGAVSTWAMKPTAGTFAPMFEGIDPIT